MNITTSAAERVIACTCDPSAASITLTVLGIILPLIISETLPFISSVVPKGIIQGLILSIRGKDIITPRNSIAISVVENKNNTENA